MGGKSLQPPGAGGKNNKTKKKSWGPRWDTKVCNRRGRTTAIKAYNAARTPSASAVWGTKNNKTQLKNNNKKQ